MEGNLHARTSTRSLWGLAGATAAAVLLAGCGGAGHLSRQQFLQRANAACAHANQSVRSLPRPASSVEGLASYAAQLEPIADRLVAELRALKAPPTAQRQFRHYMAELRADAALLPRLQTAARSDAAAARQVAAALGSGSADQLAAALGLSTCREHPAPAAAQ